MLLPDFFFSGRRNIDRGLFIVCTVNLINVLDLTEKILRFDCLFVHTALSKVVYNNQFWLTYIWTHLKLCMLSNTTMII